MNIIKSYLSKNLSMKQFIIGLNNEAQKGHYQTSKAIF